MKQLICMLAAAAMFVGCASRNTETNQGSSDTSVGTTESGTSGSLTNNTSGSQTNGTSSSRTNGTSQTQTPSQTPTQTPRGN